MSNFLNGVSTCLSWLLAQFTFVSSALMKNEIFQINVAIFCLILIIYLVTSLINIKKKKSDD